MALAGATSAAGPGVARSATPSAVSGQVRAAGAAVVRQIGARNYAGPNCPGVSWNCTTSTRVIQVATRGGVNLATVTCSLQICPYIEQIGSSNVFNCTQKSTNPAADQSCKVKQTGASNMATVSQYISQTALGSQAGTQLAEVTQGPASGGNTVYNVLKLTQSVSQSTKTLGAQVQEAHQKVLATQTAAGAGYNQSFINQSQLQKAYGGSSQSQNATADSGADCLDGAPTAPNTCSDVRQYSVNGTNYNALNQSINQDANTAVSVPAAHQTQGSEFGGLEGHVHQETTGSGSSQNKAKQNKLQKATGPANAVQAQWDPVRCCGTFSLIGPGVEDINQSSAIGATSPGALQKSDLIGESRTPGGTCKVNQHAAIDSGSANNSETLAPCYFLILTTSCTANVPTIDAPTRGENCTAAEPDRGVTSSLVKGVRKGDGDYIPATEASTGDTVDFQITYDNINTHDEAAHSVTVTDVVPAGLAYVEDSCSSEPNDCSYNPLNKTITWNLGTVPGNESPPMYFQAVVVETVSGTEITNTATAATEEEGAGAASDSATVTVVDAPPVSSLEKLVRPSCFEGCPAFDNSTTVNNGNEVEYRIAYSNNGVGDAHNVTVTDVLDAHHTYTGSCSGGTSCSYDGDTRTITWNLGTVSPTGQNPVLLFFHASVGFSCGGTTGHAANTATATSTEEPSGVQSGATDVAVLTSPC